MKYKWFGITMLMYLCVLIDGITSDLAMLDNLPGYVVTYGIEQLNATKCRTDMIQYRDGINHRILWSLAMLDSSGQPTSGFITANNFWVGNRGQCNYLRTRKPIVYSSQRTKNISLYRNPADEFPPFTVNFFGAYFRNRGTMQYDFSTRSDNVTILGLCLPDSCTEDEVATMVNKIRDKLHPFGHLYSTNFELIKVSNLKNEYTWLLNGKIITIIAILAALFGIVVAGTLYDIFIYQKRLQKLKKCNSYGSSTMGDLNGNMDHNSEPCPAYIVQKLKPDEVKQKPKYDQKAIEELEPGGCIERILVSFSITSNMKHIFQLKSSSEDITAFHGIKFFGSTWLMFLHGVYFTLSVIGNKWELYRMHNSMEYQFIANSVWSADTFLFLAGFLLAFGHFKSQRKRKKIVTVRQNAYDFLILVIKRLIRLTPPYVVTMMLGVLIFTWNNNFLMAYVVEPIPELCLKYWWRNILYIHNLFEWDSLCMTWTWQLACEMQFSIFCAFLLKLSVSHYSSAVNLGIVTLILSMLSAGYVTYTTGHIKTLESRFETFSCIYIRPWIRIIPHIVAIGTALLLEKWNYKLHLSKKALAAGWFISILCAYLVIHGPAMITTSATLTIIYEMFSRLSWSLAVAWLVIVCLTNNAATINQFLSLPYWIPPSRVVYCAYLLNPIFALLLGALSDYAVHAGIYYYATAGCAVWALSYIFAFILSAITEVPTQLLLQAFSSRRKKEV
ncbi:nose resistant to fluoxetine protein 6-like [Megachile rotundata]|uniref:nose resistant to fluoxetine protein 6-like n=1 Tax=Megachile rotundata TaxID=143995 RepID=UPI003FD4FD22